MRTMFLVLFLLTLSVNAFAQVVDQSIYIQPSTTTFSVEIPNDDIGLVTMALCSTTNDPNDVKNCSGDVAKRVVIDYINYRVKMYKQSLIDSTPVDIQ